jgi:hypothetical protein
MQISMYERLGAPPINRSPVCWSSSLSFAVMRNYQLFERQRQNSIR